jgi:hypothetical protein
VPCNRLKFEPNVKVLSESQIHAMIVEAEVAEKARAEIPPTPSRRSFFRRAATGAAVAVPGMLLASSSARAAGTKLPQPTADPPDLRHPTCRIASKKSCNPARRCPTLYPPGDVEGCFQRVAPSPRSNTLSRSRGRGQSNPDGHGRVQAFTPDIVAR